MAYLTDFMERITELTDIETTSCQYPDLAVLPDGRLAACWQRYHNKHDDIVAAFLSREGEILSQAVVSGEGQAFRPRLYVLNGTVWVIWSESSAGNWKLLARAFGEELGAVSYTHLDVYKRQGLGTSVLYHIEEGEGPA